MFYNENVIKKSLNKIGRITMNSVHIGLNEEEKALLAKLSIGSTYQHAKGKKYIVRGIARHSEDLSLYVLYEALYDCGNYGQFWIRPLDMFLEDVEMNGQKVPRFKQIS